ncbi:MAG: hypothetical protein ACRD22_10290 [Terriglobia bacterium]
MAIGLPARDCRQGIVEHIKEAAEPANIENDPQWQQFRIACPQ